MKRIIIAILALSISLPVLADEGMWLLPLLEKFNISAMKADGCHLTAEEIYSVNHSSLKDAVVQFGGGCTGEIISPEGLLVTNHHCGYSSIHRLSTPEHNYLMEGYWAMSRSEELPVEGLSVMFLKEMQDVTAQLQNDKKGKKERSLIKAAKQANPFCDVEIVDFYNDNVKYLVITQTYKDVRFVGAPAASMGKFGGETDNWVWPRHTCDFSMFRVYMSPDGKPAEYSENNIPLDASENHLKVSLAGVKENDFSMTIGYPGRTQRFQTAAQLQQMIDKQGIVIEARTIRQSVLKEAMNADPVIQLKYANKYASSANAWKKYIGEKASFEKLGIIARQQQKEAAFMEWISADPARVEKWGSAIADMEEVVKAERHFDSLYTQINENIRRIEVASLAWRLVYLESGAEEYAAEFYSSYDKDVDKAVAVAMIKNFRKNVGGVMPETDLDGFGTLSEMDVEAYVEHLYSESVLADEESFKKFIAEGGKIEDLKKDPAYSLFAQTRAFQQSFMDEWRSLSEKKDKIAKTYTEGLLEWEKGKASYPDANFTMRLSYGNVLSYSPMDAVQYNYFTTFDGVSEKVALNNPDYKMPENVKARHEARDYGIYADAADGKLHTCFITNNDITGGNSGSPVLNADGHLIGLAFDGNWDAMSSDVFFEPVLQRCICVDIRYVLWMMDKVGGATYLLDEMEIVK